MLKRVGGVVVVAMIAAALHVSTSIAGAGGGVITTFEDPSITFPRAIVLGPDGNLWFGSGSERHGAISTFDPDTQSFTSYEMERSGPTRLAVGADGNIWFNGGGFGHIDPDTGTITYLSDPTGEQLTRPDELTAGPGGNMWVTNCGAQRVTKVKPDGTMRAYPSPGGRTCGPIVAGPGGGRLWLAPRHAPSSTLRVLNPRTGTWVTRPGCGPGSRYGTMQFGPDDDLWCLGPTDRSLFLSRSDRTTNTSLTFEIREGVTEADMAFGSDGGLWIVSPEVPTLLRIDPDTGAQTDVVIDPESELLGPNSIAADANGDLWFTDQASGRLGRVDLP